MLINCAAKVHMWAISVEIEHKWKKIIENRKKISELLEKKEPYTSPELVALDDETQRLGFEARRLEAVYMAIMEPANT